MKTPLIFSLLLVGSIACRRSKDTPVGLDCRVSTDLTAPTTCYDPAAGLRLTAAGFGKEPSGFEWEVFAKLDTVNGAVDRKNLRIRMFGTPSFVVSDTLLRQVPAIGVSVLTNCDGVLKVSPPFTFVRRQNRSTGCVTWSRKF